MRKKNAGILLGMTLSAAMAAGCGSSDATDAAKESARTEQEGTGEDQEEKAEEEAKEEEEQDAQSGGQKDKTAGTVAVLLPDEGEKTWKQDGDFLKEELEEKNYSVSVNFAAGDPSTQISQIEELLAAEEPVSALILAPADGYGLAEVLSRVKEAGVPVFDYDDLIMDTDGVNYFITYDYRAMGQMVGENIIEAAGLKKVQEEGQKRSIEFLMGSLDDTDALFFFNGVKETLQPYLDDGTLFCPSGKKSFEDTGILRWDANAAKAHMREIMETAYQAGERPDIVCTGFDEAALAAYQVLLLKGVSPSGEAWPVLTGFDCGAEELEGLKDGWLTCTVFLDREVLASACAEMVDIYLGGESPEVSDYSQYDNGKKIIATRTCTGTLMDEKNYQDLQEKE